MSQFLQRDPPSSKGLKGLLTGKGRGQRHIACKRRSQSRWHTRGIIEIPEGPDRPVLLDDLDQCSPEDQAELRLYHWLAMRHKAYEHIMAKDARRVTACSIPHLEELCMLPYYVMQSWSDGLVLVQQLLLQLARQWDFITLPGTLRPIQFSADAQEAHHQAFENFQRYQDSINALQKLIGAEGNGWFSGEYFDEARKTAQKLALE